MPNLISVLTLALCAAVAAGQGTASLTNVTCGRTTYTKAQVDAAVSKGCGLYASGSQLGSSKYPHTFNNYEGLVFATSGPYQEFPILQSGVYSGQAPGPDRVVLNPSYQGACVYVGAMTHTDAEDRNGFVSCVEAKGGSSGSSTLNNVPTATRSGTSTSAPTRSGSTSSTSNTTGTASTTATASPTGNAAAAGWSVRGGQGAVLGVVAGLLLL